MTNEEKAEEYANNGYALGCTKSPFEVAKIAFKDGLEFSYNKCNEQLTKAKELINIAIEGIKYWGIVGGY